MYLLATLVSKHLTQQRLMLVRQCEQHCRLLVNIWQTHSVQPLRDYWAGAASAQINTQWSSAMLAAVRRPVS